VCSRSACTCSESATPERLNSNTKPDAKATPSYACQREALRLFSNLFGIFFGTRLTTRGVSTGPCERDARHQAATCLHFSSLVASVLLLYLSSAHVGLLHKRLLLFRVTRLTCLLPNLTNRAIYAQLLKRHFIRWKRFQAVCVCPAEYLHCQLKVCTYGSQTDSCGHRQVLPRGWH
jgi:hypothetical protein